ncbi:MAG: TIGR03915 family putative DNA repair protein [Treponema sp.]|nr:TIGR03915 family putative DNA repair protein [Treponema sp.]
MRFGLVQLFEAIIGKTGDALPPNIGVHSKDCNDSQGELFGGFENFSYNIVEKDIAIAAGMHMETGIDFSDLPPEIFGFYELSANAFGAIVYAWMSELPVTGQTIRFGKKILAAKNTVTNNTGPTQRGKLEAAQRKAAGLAAADRGDFDVQAVREAAYKVWHETNRLMGLLRFCPDEKGVYTAQCEPDHFVLPALGPHFMERFGGTPWAIIDNRRRLSLCCKMGQTGAAGGTFEFSANAESPFSFEKGQGWENLWRHYHKTINNESRNNPELQKRFMPTRYWKYLTEM